MPHIKFITADPVVAENFSVEPAKKVIPDWYKNTPKFLGSEDVDGLIKNGNTSNRSIKACVPVLDYLTSGYVIKTVSHTKFKNENGEDFCGIKYVTSDNSSISTHSHKQCPVRIEGERKTYIKFNSPWIIKTPPGYSCYFYQPFFHMENRFTLMPGIVDTDTYHKPINFPGWINGNEEVEVEPGVPLVALFPFKREEWKSEVIVDQNEIVKPTLFDKLLNEAYKRFYWKPKSYR
jgi:hypothetical protein